MLLAIGIFHFIGLALLVGGGISNGVVLARAGTSDDAAKAALRSVTRRLGQISFIGLILLWITGVYWVKLIFGGWGDVPLLFWGKMVAVVLLSVSALAAQMYSIVAIFSGSRTPREKVIRLTAITTLLALVALVLAVMTSAFSRNEPTADMPAAAPAEAPATAPAEPQPDTPAELPTEPSGT